MAEEDNPLFGAINLSSVSGFTNTPAVLLLLFLFFCLVYEEVPEDTRALEGAHGVEGVGTGGGVEVAKTLKEN